MVHYYFIEISHKFTWEWQLNTSSQSAKIGFQGKKKFVSKGAHNFSKKITIMEISIMYADFSYIVHDRWPTVLGMKKC